MIAIASDVEGERGVITVARRPRRWMCIRSAISNTGAWSSSMGTSRLR
jgi:hypothetical protein